ncbi:MAG: PfkB family carbohydrate kinase, partial [Rhodovulum sp.]
MATGPKHAAEVLCIGAVLWDVIGRSRGAMALGDDLPGRITRRPGGVALNVAAALAREGMRPVLLGAIGEDAEGHALCAVCDGMGIETAHLHRATQHPTDIYIAIEADQGLVGAVADTAGLEAAGAAILAPLSDGRLGADGAPFRGIAVVDGNLPEALLAEVAAGPALARADLRLAPASPAKARRIAPLMGDRRVTLYLNRAEAGVLLGRVFPDAATAGGALRAAGVR